MQCILYGILNDEKYKKMHDISRRVYDPNGIAPTIHCVGGGNLEPKIAVNSSKGYEVYLIEDFYKDRPTPNRVYENYAPSLRADREGLKVVYILHGNTESKSR